MNEGRSMVVKSPPEIMGTRIIDLLDGDFIQFLQTLDCILKQKGKSIMDNPETIVKS